MCAQEHNLWLVSTYLDCCDAAGTFRRDNGAMDVPASDAIGVLGCQETNMSQRASFQEVLRKLAIIDEGFVGGQAGLGLNLPDAQVLDPKTAALVRVGALVAIGSPGVCLEWSTSRALAAGATEDEIASVLLAIAPVAGLGRVTGAVPDVAEALGFDVQAALVGPDDQWS
jgi:alkylhydroperoxidase/carboxymuconolactone decarboxylase family protein YurZ